MRIRWRGLELPSQVLKDEVISTRTYGRFIIEPFERGFGTTVGQQPATDPAEQSGRRGGCPR